eukprot:840268-Lingulodinium_polyedra.AAC.1
MPTPAQLQFRAEAEDVVAEEDVATIPVENALSEQTFQVVENASKEGDADAVSYTHLRAHET